MKAVGGLAERLWERSNLAAALWRAARGKSHRPEVQNVFQQADEVLSEMSAALRAGTYAFSPYRSFPVRDTKRREIHAPVFRDRVVHHAMIAILGPVLERGALEHSYACRAGRGQHVALRQAWAWTRRGRWYGKVDVEKFYDQVHHEGLRARLARRFREPAVLDLWDRLLESYETVPGRGIPIGALTSQYLGNFILDEVDHRAKATGAATRYLRYMDDMVWWGKREEAKRVRGVLAESLDRLGLRMKHGGEWNACERGVPYLGFVLYPDRIRLNRQGRKRLRRKLGVVEKLGLRGRISEEELQARVTSLFAHAQVGDDEAWRRMVVARSRWQAEEDKEDFGDGQEPAARGAGRFLEQRGQELPLREPEQERSAASQCEPGLSGLGGSRHGGGDPPDDVRSRSRVPMTGRDEANPKPSADPPQDGRTRRGCRGRDHRDDKA